MLLASVSFVAGANLIGVLPNIINNTINQDIKDNVNVIATVKGPKSAVKGQKVIFEYIVYNNGKKIVYDVQTLGQCADKCQNLGDLKPEESKSFTIVQYIPTDKEIIEPGYPGHYTYNTYPVGGGVVHFKDEKGKEYEVCFESYDLKVS